MSTLIKPAVFSGSQLSPKDDKPVKQTSDDVIAINMYIERMTLKYQYFGFITFLRKLACPNLPFEKTS